MNRIRIICVAAGAFLVVHPTHAAGQATTLPISGAFTSARQAVVIDSLAAEVLSLPPQASRNDSAAPFLPEADRAVVKDSPLDTVRTFVRAPFALRDGTLHVPSQATLDSAYQIVRTLWSKAYPSGESSGGRQLGPLRFTKGIDVHLPSQAELIVGAADFVIERAKDELVFEYMGRLQRSLDSSPALKNLMPRSTAALGQVQEISYHALLPTLRGALVADLQGLPVTATDPLTYPNANFSADATFRLRMARIGALRLQEIRNGLDPVAALGNLADVRRDSVADARVLMLLQLMGSAARDYSGHGDEYVALLGAPRSREVYAAYLLAQHETVIREALTVEGPPGSGGAVEGHGAATAGQGVAVVPKPASLADAITYIRTHEEPLSRFAGSLASLAAKVDELHEALQHPALGDSARAVTAQVYLPVTRAAIQTLAAGRGLVPDAVMANATYRTKIDEFFGFVDYAGRMQEALAGREYGRAVTETLVMLNRVVPALNASCASDTSAKPAGDACIAVGLNRQAMQFLSLAAQLSSADSAAAVTQAFMTAAAPVSTFRTKWREKDDKTRPVAVYLNAYIGAGVSRETPLDRTNASDLPTSWAFGAMLPIGVEVVRRNQYAPVGLFLSPVDLGTVASVRLKGSEKVSQEPSIGWRQLIAPGAFVTLHTRSPFTLGGGVQWVPQLRQAADGDQKISVWRGGVFLAVDVPIIRL